MQVKRRDGALPAPQVAEAVAAMYRGKRERPLSVLVRDKLGEWLADEQFAGAYGVRGKLGWPPSRLALVTVFQKVEDLTDRQAAECIRTRIDWKYALGLDLADPGFDHWVLSEFRARVAGGGLDQVVPRAVATAAAPQTSQAPVCGPHQGKATRRKRAAG